MSLRALMGELERSAGSPRLDELVRAALEPEADNAGPHPSDCTTNLVAAILLLKRVYPGWSWRVAECSVSDDAWLAPDFNCPVHGERLKALYSQSADWAGMTDVDLRPSGRVAVALCISMLKAKELVDGGLYVADARTD